MGREWYHLSGGTKSSSSSSSYSSTSKTPRSRRRDNIKETSSSSSSSKYENSSSSLSTTTTTTTTTTGAGCMSAVFQLFDFHLPLYHHQPTPFKFSLTTTASSHEEEPSIDHHVLKVIDSSGTEAPRNSLECESSPLPLPSSANIIRKDENLLMPKMGIQIKTSRDKKSTVASSPDLEVCSSPGTKTPTIVARLMGLDLLPDSTSSSPRTSSTQRPSVHASRTPNRRWSTNAGRKSCSDVETSYGGTRSLPETPRMSLGRRSDVEHHHRPTSLHINYKENARRAIVGEDDFDCTRLIKRELCSSEDGVTRSPGHYARQIVKQVKETMSRRVGMIDITNTMRSRSEQAGSTNKDHIFKPKKTPRNPRPVAEDTTVPSCSPRLGLPDTNKMRRDVPHCPDIDLSGSTKDATRMKSLRPNCDYRLASSTDFMKNNKQENPFVRASKSSRSPSSNHSNNDGTDVDKKCKPTPSGIRKRGGAPATVATAAVALPVKRDPSPPATKIPHKQMHDIQTNSKQLSVCTSHRYRHEAGNMVMVREKGNVDKPSVTTTIATTSITSRQAELQYVSEILRSSGLERDTQLSSFTGWFAVSHPLDPSIFSGLERNSASACSVDDPNSVRRRCDRKLVFELVDELLADLLRPYSNHKPWINVLRTGSQLIDRVRAKIESFPRADCQVLEDIDAIINVDLAKSEVRSRRGSEEEGNDIVSELERDIWEDLVREVVTEEPLMVQVGVVRGGGGAQVGAVKVT